ncbi:hypothetical protein [Halostella sp. PRR32]|uniref:DUF7577 domain-containing protein n=1 Tax=Halostella sp. PRR32 TaxID=3098147 RepID=UPI002B1D5297|nr:hypothetical protein [Halostella sp. PRR32]
MDIPQWALIYVVSFALLHLAIYYYYLRGEQGDDSANPSFSGENGGDYSPRKPVPRDRRDAPQDLHDAGRSEQDDVDGRRCPHCGTINESNPTYTYCYECVKRLGM